jgi:hypothetical protein
LATVLAFCFGAAIIAGAVGLAVDVVPPVAVQVIAAVWVIGTMLGCLDTIVTLRQARVEQRTAHARNDIVLVDMATANVRRELFRLLELVSLCIIGLLALRGPGTSVVVSRLLILYVVMLLVSNARLDRQERKRTDELVRQHRRRVIQESVE